MVPYKSRENLGEFYYLVEKFIKKAPEIAQIENDIGNWVKILEIFGQNRMEFV